MNQPYRLSFGSWVPVSHVLYPVITFEKQSLSSCKVVKFPYAIFFLFRCKQFGYSPHLSMSKLSCPLIALKDNFFVITGAFNSRSVSQNFQLVEHFLQYVASSGWSDFGLSYQYIILGTLTNFQILSVIILKCIAVYSLFRSHLATVRLSCFCITITFTNTFNILNLSFTLFFIISYMRSLLDNLLHHRVIT